MRYGSIPGLEKPISRLVQGCVSMTTQTTDRDFALLDAILEAGCNTFDSARCYGAGESERTLGLWIESRGNRERVVISTKGADPSVDRHRVTPYDIIGDIHDSLARLRTDYIDLYFLHRDNPEVPVEPIIDVLNALQREGKLRAFGASNWSPERIEAANRYALDRQLIPFAVSSPNICLAERLREPWGGCLAINLPRHKAALDWHIERRIPVFAWSSLAGGFFSGRFRPDNLDTFTDYLDQVCVEAYCHEENFRRYERAAAMAHAKGCTIPQIALAYVLNLPIDVYALLGCRTADEMRENMLALDIRLTPEEIAWLDGRIGDNAATT